MTRRAAEVEYAAATEAHNAALRAYEPVRVAYFAREIGDAEFLVARKVVSDALARFDAAYFVMQELGEEETVVVEESNQLELI